MALDRISNLPLSIIQMILTLMPIRDAFRTSVLSRKWRFNCINIPKLEFDDNLWEELAEVADRDFLETREIFQVVYNVLLLHHDPVIEFSLRYSELESCDEIDRIILYLSRNTTLQKFTLYVGLRDQHRLPSTFFSMQNLTHLKLRNCEIQPLLSTCGFGLLTNLRFENVDITMSSLLNLLHGCPMLKSFSLIHPRKNGYLNFFEIFRCLPLIEYLHIYYTFNEPFTFGISQERQLPNMLLHLKVLKLEALSFFRKDHLHSVVLLVASSPNIEKINLKMDRVLPETSQIPINPFDLHDYSRIILDKLWEMEIIHFSSNKPEMDFVKFILSNSPVLKTVRIKIAARISVEDELEILKDLLLIPRASTGAQIKFDRH